MTPVRKVFMVVATLFLAVAAGQTVQSQAEHKREADAARAADIVPTKVILLSATTDTETVLPHFPDTPAVLPARRIGLDGYVPADDRGLVHFTPDPQARSVPFCNAGLSVASTPAAMLAVRLDAPCHVNERVVIRHEALAITGRTNDLGQLQIGIPALAAGATVTVAFADGATLSGKAAVPDLADFDRVGVQWQGKAAFALHALEFGATETGRGHVSAVDPRNPSFAERGIGGFLSILGDASVPDPLLAEVYSFPAAHVVRHGTVRIYLEAAVTPDTCGREIMGETLDLRRGLRLRTMDLSLPMPGCDALGQLLVLKNLLPDMKIAQN